MKFIESQNLQKKIAVINDFSGFGRCSLAVSIPVISALKIQCCPLPTAIFSNHTGFPSFYRTDFTEHMVPYAEEWQKVGISFNGIATGFLGSVEQIQIVENFIGTFKKENTLVIVDPVMGDYGKLYPTYTRELAGSMKTLVKHAHVLTPNLTEACILTDTEYQASMSPQQMEEICRTLNSMGPDRIVISGLDYGTCLGNFVFEKNPVTQKESCKMMTFPKIGECRSGTGDVFSSIISADLVNGIPFEKAVAHAANFIIKAIKRSIELQVPKTDGIAFEELLSEIGEMI